MPITREHASAVEQHLLDTYPQRVMQIISDHPLDEEMDEVVWVLIFDHQRETLEAACRLRHLKVSATDFTSHVPGTDADCRFDEALESLWQYFDSSRWKLLDAR